MRTLRNGTGPQKTARGGRNVRWLILLALLLLVIIKLWPKGLWIVLSAAALIVGAGLYWMHLEERQLEQVVITVRHDGEGCPAKRPLRVHIRNASEATLEKAHYSIHARVPGYSSVVTPYTYKQYASEKILQPGEEFSVCEETPRLTRTAAESYPPESLEWSATADRAWFK